jgi:2-octaprenyl-6-methoxyphenol hydroxylase
VSNHETKQHFDITIVGGGMTGASLALMLAAQKCWRIMLVEAFPMQTGSEQTRHYQPSFDARSTALSYSTRKIFESLGLWHLLEPHTAPITQIQVSDRGHIASTQFNAKQDGFDAYGYVIENRLLGQVLNRALSQQTGNEGQIYLAAPAQVSATKIKRDGVELCLNDRDHTIHTRLLVVADGAQSKTRDLLGIAHHVTDYRQMGLIANVALSKPHQGMAYERFTAEGPMALLPLPEVNNAQRSALIWSLPPTKAQHLAECGEAEFLEQLHQSFGYRQGDFSAVGERHLYPLKRIESEEQVRRHVVIIGNAAHTLHPVAGQGFNLALRDVAALAETLNEAATNHQSPGDLELLQRYQDKQATDQQRTIGGSDLLPKLFSVNSDLMAGARGAGLLAMDIIPSLRAEFAHIGMGLASPAAKHAK